MIKSVLIFQLILYPGSMSVHQVQTPLASLPKPRHRLLFVFLHRKVEICRDPKADPSPVDPPLHSFALESLFPANQGFHIQRQSHSSCPYKKTDFADFETRFPPFEKYYRFLPFEHPCHRQSLFHAFLPHKNEESVH